jgi:hypothetical protein
MLIRQVTFWAIERSELALPGDASFETLLHLLSGCLLEWIRAPATKKRAYYRDQDGKPLHPLILRRSALIARL